MWAFKTSILLVISLTYLLINPASSFSCYVCENCDEVEDDHIQDCAEWEASITTTTTIEETTTTPTTTTTTTTTPTESPDTTTTGGTTTQETTTTATESTTTETTSTTITTTESTTTEETEAPTTTPAATTTEATTTEETNTPTGESTTTTDAPSNPTLTLSSSKSKRYFMGQSKLSLRNDVYECIKVTFQVGENSPQTNRGCHRIVAGISNDASCVSFLNSENEDEVEITNCEVCDSENCNPASNIKFSPILLIVSLLSAVYLIKF